MQQPKFKSGDLVIHVNEKKIFTIKHVILNEKYWQYSGEDYWAVDKSLYIDDYLELYQEPKKKKLYAYRYKMNGEMRFFVNDTDFEANPYWEPSPEYDIEYPEVKE